MNSIHDLPQDSFSFQPLAEDALDFYQGLFEVGELMETDPRQATAKLFLALAK